ncbi:MAG: hypothetical protein QF893_13740 [Alphaproteobacteria bacterium]|jgi:hypothetical protein|nr:hypothetical protein [Alphaproteobacteria bacterium]
MKIEINTFSRLNSRLIDINDYTGTIRNSDYIEGSIEVKIGRTAVLSKDVWDDVNYLWPYIGNAIEDVCQGKDAEFYYPDQPIRVKLRLLSGQRLSISCSVGSSRRRAEATCDRVRLLTELLRGGIAFFDALSKIPGSDKGFCEIERRRFEGLISSME